ncbi:MAG: nucleotidyltransferase family protein [Candidatus Hydrogenedentes bacterium]|nr:nucleotidyltransferase family protein [Candidatus Hydrogenedentota bacterium]
MTLTKKEVLEYLRAGKSKFEREYGVRQIGVFGSLARNESTPESDLDILVEMPEPTFDGYMDLKFELEDRFGVTVDLVLRETLKDGLRPVIEQETVYA